MRDFSPVNHGSDVARDFSPVNHSISPANNGEQYITDGYEVSSGYLLLGKIFDYETGFGRVTIQTKGTSEKIRVKVLPNTEVAATYFLFSINSHFAGFQAGSTNSSAKLFSIKTLFSTKSVGARNFVPLPSSPKFGIQYKFLNSNTISFIHFLDLFGTKNFGTVDVTVGLTSYFGKDVETEIGGFVNMTHSLGKTFNFFAEYNSLDFMKAVQNHLLAPSAKNIGTVNTSSAPKDAFSLGFNLILDKKLNLKFTVYDLDLQMKPFLEAGFLK